jgi:biopolymer transport protein ExbD
MLGGISPTTRVGLALALIPLASLGGWAAWYFTRSWEPLNIPISLARGHLRAEFDINIESLYAIKLQLNQDREAERLPCPDTTYSCDTVSLAGAPWSISNGESVVATGRGDPEDRDIWWNRSVGTFQCGKGHRVLTLDVLEDQSRLNFFEPHLVIYEAGGKELSDSAVGALSLLAIVLFGPVGASMTILAAMHWRQAKLAAFWKANPLSQPGPTPDRFLPVARKNIAIPHRMKSSIQRPLSLSRLSTHSLVLVLTFMILWTTMVVATSLERLIPWGLPVHLTRPGVMAPRSPGIQPLLVRVRRQGQDLRATLYVDSQIVASEDFGPLLKKELASRPPDWPVYVEADPDLEWRSVAQTIDAIRGKQAEVVLLTNRARSQ